MPPPPSPLFLTWRVTCHYDTHCLLCLSCAHLSFRFARLNITEACCIPPHQVMCLSAAWDDEALHGLMHGGKRGDADSNGCGCRQD